MPENQPRIPPIKPDEWTDEVRDLFTVMDGPEAREKGPSRQVMLYLAQHPKLSNLFMTFGREILRDSSLPHRERELATLYIGWTTRSDYEWLSHVAFGLQVGLTEEDIEAVKQGPESPHWTAPDRDLLRLVDQMRDHYSVDDELWASLSGRYDQRQMIEWIYTVGNYMLFSAVFNSLQIPVEPEMQELARKFGIPGN